MTQVDDLSRSLIAFEQNSTMVVVLEMSQSSWLAGYPCWSISIDSVPLCVPLRL